MRRHRQGGYLYEIPLFLLLLLLGAALLVPRLPAPRRTVAIAVAAALALGGLLRLLFASGTIVGGKGGLAPRHRARIPALVLAVAVLAAAAAAAVVTVMGRAG
jgi:hypothetical protein